MMWLPSSNDPAVAVQNSLQDKGQPFYFIIQSHVWFFEKDLVSKIVSWKFKQTSWELLLKLRCCSQIFTVKNVKWEKLDKSPHIHSTVFVEQFRFNMWVSNRYITAHWGHFKELLLFLFIGVFFLQFNVLHSRVIAFKKTVSMNPQWGCSVEKYVV